MQFGWQKLSRTGTWKIAGNLPYNIASPLIWDIIARCTTLKRAVFMVQREVALRIAACPSTKSYGALSAWVQSFSQPSICFTLAPGAFTPPPKVDSAVVLFEPRTTRPQYPDALKKLLAICFQKRRKQLGTIFRQANMPQLISGAKACGIALDCRPENICPGQFGLLAEWLHNNSWFSL